MPLWGELRTSFTGTLLSPVLCCRRHTRLDRCKKKKSSYRENLLYGVPWFSRNLAHAGHFFTTFLVYPYQAPQQSCPGRKKSSYIENLLHEVPWFRRNLDRAGHFFSPFFNLFLQSSTTELFGELIDYTVCPAIFEDPQGFMVHVLC